MQHGLTLTETLLQKTALTDTINFQDSWEVGRLVLDPEYRNGQSLLKKFLLISLLTLLEKHDVKKLFASCSPLLSRLYGRFGFSILAKDIPLSNSEKNYHLIHGDSKKILTALSPW